jgi:hypothetical protein
MPRFIHSDREKLAAYISSIENGLVVFDGRNGNGKTYMARQMQRQLRCKALDVDCCFLVPDQKQFVGALLLDEMRACVEAHLARTPLVVLSTICGREVIQRAKLQAKAFVWIEHIPTENRDDAHAWFAADRDLNRAVEGGRPRGPLLDELENYVEAHKAREQPDVVYFNVFDAA